MAKRSRITPASHIAEDRYLTVEDVERLLAVSSGHVYMLEKFGHIQAIDISVSGDGGPKTKRFSLLSVMDFVKKRQISNGE